MREQPWHGVPEDDPAQVAEQRAEAIKALREPLPSWSGQDIEVEAFLHWVERLVPGLVGALSLPIGIARHSAGAVMLGGGCLAILLSLGGFRLRRRWTKLFARRIRDRVGKAARVPALCLGAGFALGGTAHLAHANLAATWILVAAGTAVTAAAFWYRYWQDLRLSRWLGATPRTTRRVRTRRYARRPTSR
jgi:hypothetical protein